MNDLINHYFEFLTAFVGGLCTGALFCIALWHSVRRLNEKTPKPGNLIMGSVLRVGLVLVALYLITDLRAAQTMFALAGFVIARMLVSSYLGHVFVISAKHGQAGRT